jgi:hypothetical protein
MKELIAEFRALNPNDVSPQTTSQIIRALHKMADSMEKATAAPALRVMPPATGEDQSPEGGQQPPTVTDPMAIKFLEWQEAIRSQGFKGTLDDYIALHPIETK